MLKHVAVSPHRARADSVSLVSSTSCCSLGSIAADSMPDLSEKYATIKVFARCLREDVEYKTLRVSWNTRASEVVTTLLGKFRMRHRDPKLFYLSMEVRVPSTGLRTTLILDDDAKPAALQSCHPRGYSRFVLQMRPGGLVKVFDTVVNPQSQYKSLLISERTTADELIALLLNCSHSMEPVERFSLYEICGPQEYERKLHPDDLPLRVTRAAAAAAQIGQRKSFESVGAPCRLRIRRSPRPAPRTNLPPALPPKPYRPVYKLPAIDQNSIIDHIHHLYI